MLRVGESRGRGRLCSGLDGASTLGGVPQPRPGGAESDRRDSDRDQQFREREADTTTRPARRSARRSSASPTVSDGTIRRLAACRLLHSRRQRAQTHPHRGGVRAGGGNEADFDRRRGKRGRPPDCPSRHGRGGQGRPACRSHRRKRASQRTSTPHSVRRGHEHRACPSSCRRPLRCSGSPSACGKTCARSDGPSGSHDGRRPRWGERVVRQRRRDAARSAVRTSFNAARAVDERPRFQRVAQNDARSETQVGQEDRCSHRCLDEREAPCLAHALRRIARTPRAAARRDDRRHDEAARPEGLRRRAGWVARVRPNSTMPSG